jgi:hypothetical protein
MTAQQPPKEKPASESTPLPEAEPSKYFVMDYLSAERLEWLRQQNLKVTELYRRSKPAQDE